MNGGVLLLIATYLIALYLILQQFIKKLTSTKIPIKRIRIFCYTIIIIKEKTEIKGTVIETEGTFSVDPKEKSLQDADALNRFEIGACG